MRVLCFLQAPLKICSILFGEVGGQWPAELPSDPPTVERDSSVPALPRTSPRLQDTARSRALEPCLEKLSRDYSAGEAAPKSLPPGRWRGCGEITRRLSSSGGNYTDDGGPLPTKGLRATTHVVR